jgi:hypothetical protein
MRQAAEQQQLKASEYAEAVAQLQQDAIRQQHMQLATLAELHALHAALAEIGM